MLNLRLDVKDYDYSESVNYKTRYMLYYRLNFVYCNKNTCTLLNTLHLQQYILLLCNDNGSSFYETRCIVIVSSLCTCILLNSQIVIEFVQFQ